MEVFGILDDGKHGLAMDTDCFARTASYWSWTSSRSRPAQAWFIDLETGLVSRADKPEPFLAVDELRIADNTYIFYMADNGMNSEALKGGKTSLDEGGIRVPLIVAGPRIRGGLCCNDPVVGYDLFPTVLDFAAPGFALPKGIEGGSWKPALMSGGKDAVRRPIDRIVFHIDTEADRPQSALRKGDLKLLHFWDTKEDFLYDIAADLGERSNLAGAKPGVAARLVEELKAHVRAGLGDQKFAALESGKVLQAGDRPKREKGKGNRGAGRKKEGQDKRSPAN